MKRIKQLKAIIGPWDGFETEVSDCLEMAELIEADDPDGESSDAAQLAKDADSLMARYHELEFKMMLSGEMDANNAFLHIHAGAGGTESCDWAAMLMRMYLRWAEARGFEVEELELQPGDEAGIKSVTLLLKGDFAYGYLKAEIGIHRLVRISPFDSNSRRHTSFSSVYVDPEIEDDVDIEIDEKDIRIDTYRASGAGGQHVNKTSSAVRITHTPTNIVVQCQNDRSQHKNKATAMKMLRARLYQKEMDDRAKEAASRAAEKKEIGWGSQIRSYVLHPYNMVKDLRTEHETSNTTAVLDGDLDPFINEYLKQGMGSDLN
jgi:peptide chain release factor 2